MNDDIRWGALVAEVRDSYAERVAIYDERFPAELNALEIDLKWFTSGVALEVLQRFVGAWPSLGRRPDDPADQRSVYWSVPGGGVLRFVGRNLAHPDLRSAQVVVFAVSVVVPGA